MHKPAFIETFYSRTINRLKPIMLNIIPSRTSQFFSYFIPIALSIIFFYSIVSMDNITMQEWLCIIYIVTDYFKRMFDCSIEYLDFFAIYVAEQSKHLGWLGSC